MGRPRDGSRSKVLNALLDESAMIAEAQRLLAGRIVQFDWYTDPTQKILRSAWFKKQFGLGTNHLGAPPTTMHVQGCGSQACESLLRGSVLTAWVAKPTSTRRLDVLHGIAHLLQPPDSALHGTEFCRLLLDLAGRYGFMTDDRATDKRALNAVFRAAKIKRSTVSPEARERARQRYQDVHVEQLEDNLKALWRELKGGDDG